MPRKGLRLLVTTILILTPICVLALGDNNGIITGKVLLADGSPAIGAYVLSKYASKETGPADQSQSPDGQYTLTQAYVEESLSITAYLPISDTEVYYGEIKKPIRATANGTVVRPIALDKKLKLAALT